MTKAKPPPMLADLAVHEIAGLGAVRWIGGDLLALLAIRRHLRG